MDAKGGLRFRQLDVGFPQIFIRPVRDVRPKQLAAGAQSRPVSRRIDLRPFNVSGTRVSFGHHSNGNLFNNAD